jgi:photosystem II stability/assembly factor-like uncharacterized protein
MNPKSPNKLINRLTDLIFYSAIFIFIVALAFPHNPAGNWYQQFLPNIGGRTITDVTFTDSLNGYAITSEVSDTSFILRTTNGGDNWFLSHFDTGVCSYYNIQFINQNTGFVSGYIYNGSTFRIVKTTNGGISWFYINFTSDIVAIDMFVLNQDTIWLVDSGSLTGGVFRTTNGGVNWQNQLNIGSNNPNHVYFYNGRLGFICEDNFYLRRTTDGGANWSVVPGIGGFLDMYFADSLTGWKTSFQKTTDGGLNWVNQPVPQGGNILISQIVKFDNIVNDTIWGVGSTIMTGIGNRGMVCRSTNSGNTWLFQVPDSNINIFQYQHTEFVKPLIGWAYSGITGVHTTAGGDPIFYMPVTQIGSEVPKEYKLYNNYPNPFNPKSNIKYQIPKSNVNVKIAIYDIQGKEIAILVNEKQSAGTYEVDFDGSNYSSGIYLYSLIVDNKVIETKRMALIK